MIEDGYSLRNIAADLNVDASAICHWIREDQQSGGAGLAQRYARATEVRWDMIADELLELVQRDCRGPDGRPDNALVQQLRLDVDTRKWLLSKMIPRKYGDRIEISGDPDAPVVSRIELVAVQPREPVTIEALPSDGTKDPQKS